MAAADGVFANGGAIDPFTTGVMGRPMEAIAAAAAADVMVVGPVLLLLIGVVPIANINGGLDDGVGVLIDDNDDADNVSDVRPLGGGGVPGR